MKELECPEHDKLKAIKEEKEVITDFLAYLTANTSFNMPDCQIRAALDGFFDIDQKKLNDEKMEMIQLLRNCKSTDEEK